MQLGQRVPQCSWHRRLSELWPNAITSRNNHSAIEIVVLKEVNFGNYDVVRRELVLVLRVVLLFMDGEISFEYWALLAEEKN